MTPDEAAAIGRIAAAEEGAPRRQVGWAVKSIAHPFCCYGTFRTRKGAAEAAALLREGGNAVHVVEHYAEVSAAGEPLTLAEVTVVAAVTGRLTGRIILCEDIGGPHSRCRTIEPLGTCDPECGRYITPSGYNAHADWAEDMLVDHEQRRCPGCGRWTIWVPRTVESERGGAT